MSERFYQWLAWKLPRRVALWCYIRVMAHATTTIYSDQHPDDVGYSAAYKAWEEQ